MVEETEISRPVANDFGVSWPHARSQGQATRIFKPCYVTGYTGGDVDQLGSRGKHLPTAEPLQRRTLPLTHAEVIPVPADNGYSGLQHGC